MSDGILVTGIGGNVGQGILRILRVAYPGTRLIGTNTLALSGGNHLCDQAYRVPYAWEDGYVDRMARICGDERVGLILPATDHETSVLAENEALLPTVASSPAPTCKVFLDKLLTAEAFDRLGLPFARTCRPAAYDGQFVTTIVKPRLGRGSRDIHVDHPDPQSFSDDFVVQERAVGREITVGFYVKANGELHDFVALERTLESGMTMLCWVVHDLDEQLRELLTGLVAGVDIRGSCNVQLIATDDGRTVPFEVNGRISGTASIRDQLGFTDVRWTVAERTNGEPPKATGRLEGTAVRMVVDVIYPTSTPAQLVESADHPHVVF